MARDTHGDGLAAKDNHETMSVDEALIERYAKLASNG
jgi:hypothetical protein